MRKFMETSWAKASAFMRKSCPTTVSDGFLSRTSIAMVQPLSRHSSTPQPRRRAYRTKRSIMITQQITNRGFNRKDRRDRRCRGPFFAFFVFFATNSLCNGQIQQAWVAKYNNGITNGTHQAVKMALDTNGNIYVTGFSQNTNGNLGYATVKY